jgi:hypothetical protein
MPDILILEFSGGTREHYDQVNDLLGVDTRTGSGDWPQGLISHTGAATAAGDLVVIEVWESTDAQAAFMDSRLGPALHKAEVPPPTRIEWLTHLAHTSSAGSA